MKRFIQNIKNIWKVEELRKRILLTLGLILVYRIGSFIILPGVNYVALEKAQAAGGQNTLETLLSLFSGGGFSNASIMALGIMPYISASIIMQLLGMAVPAVQKMQNELKKGDKVVTIGGLHGIVDSVDEVKVIIKCGDGSRLTFERNAIRDVVESV